MPQCKRRRLGLYWPHGCHMGPWFHPMAPFVPPGGWGSGWGWNRPTREEEKEYLDEYIEVLKEELAAAEEYRKELEEADWRLAEPQSNSNAASAT